MSSEAEAIDVLTVPAVTGVELTTRVEVQLFRWTSNAPFSFTVQLTGAPSLVTTENVGGVLSVPADPVSDVIDTEGAVVSMVQVKLAAEPVLPALSTARTWNVCDPSPRPV